VEHLAKIISQIKSKIIFLLIKISILFFVMKDNNIDHARCFEKTQKQGKKGGRLLFNKKKPVPFLFP